MLMFRKEILGLLEDLPHLKMMVMVFSSTIIWVSLLINKLVLLNLVEQVNPYGVSLLIRVCLKVPRSFNLETMTISTLTLTISHLVRCQNSACTNAYLMALIQ
jgi:hypothetical protein